jgi:hypothetical protein
MLVSLLVWLAVLPDSATAYYNRGTVQMTVGASTISISVGQSATVSVILSPASFEGTIGCGLPGCPQTCEAKCGDEITGQCTCAGSIKRMNYASVVLGVAQPYIASAAYSSGVVTIQGLAAGTTSISLRGILLEHTDSPSQLIQVNVSDPINLGAPPTLPPNLPQLPPGSEDILTQPVQAPTLPPLNETGNGNGPNGTAGGSIPAIPPVLPYESNDAGGMPLSPYPTPTPGLQLPTPSAASAAPSTIPDAPTPLPSPGVPSGSQRDLPSGPVRLTQPGAGPQETPEPAAVDTPGQSGLAAGISGSVPSATGSGEGLFAQQTGSGETTGVIPQLALPAAGRQGTGGASPDSGSQTANAAADQTGREQPGETEASQEQTKDVMTRQGPLKLVTLTDEGPTGKAEMEEAKNTNGRVTFQKLDEAGNVIYSWTFRGADIVSPADIDMRIEFSDQPVVMQAQAESLSKPFYLSLAHDGVLPGKAGIYIRVNDRYAAEENLSLYYFNEDQRDIEAAAKNLEPQAGYVSFELEHASEYALALGQQNSLSRNLAIILSAVTLLLAAAFITASLVMGTRRRKALAGPAPTGETGGGA